jgi:hypothetical protein
MTTMLYYVTNKKFQVYVPESIIVYYKLVITNYCEDDICKGCIELNDQLNEENYNYTPLKPIAFDSFQNCTCSVDDTRFGYRLMIISIPNPRDITYKIHYSSSELIKNSDFIKQLTSLTFPNMEVFNVKNKMDMTSEIIEKYHMINNAKTPVVYLSIYNDTNKNYNNSMKNYQFITQCQHIIEELMTNE